MAFRPRFADFVLKMPRGAQVVYPKDLGPIVTYADVFPGARVLEAGTGSGALTIALCRAAGPEGRVVSYELRAEHREQAVGEHRDVLREDPADARAARRETSPRWPGRAERFDRAVLDLPDPWASPGGAGGRARARGRPRVPTCPRSCRCSSWCWRLPAAGFHHLETFETLKRGWHVTGRSVRPDHRMVGHTGFLGDRASPDPGTHGQRACRRRRVASRRDPGSELP